MSFKNFLDLRKKPPTQIQIIEKIIFQKRSIKSDIFLALSVMFVASGIIWGISKANDISSSFSKSQTKNFSASGIVLNIDEINLYIDQAKGSDDLGKTNYTFSLLDNPKIETDEYASLSISNIQLGAKVVVQGKIDGGNIRIKRIIYFGIVTQKEITATTTTEVATSTATNTATTSESVIPAEVVIQPEDIDSATATTTSTTSSVIPASVSTSTYKESTSGFQEVPENENANASSNESASSTTLETISNAIIDTAKDVGEIVKDAVETIIEIVTNTPSDSTNKDSLNADDQKPTDAPQLKEESPKE